MLFASVFMIFIVSKYSKPLKIHDLLKRQVASLCMLVFVKTYLWNLTICRICEAESLQSEDRNGFADGDASVSGGSQAASRSCWANWARQDVPALHWESLQVM